MAKLPRIPDLLTTANLCCGVGSILLASQGELVMACWLVFAGAGFDVLDGLAARALGGGSELGKQLDSLADMVTFGVAPGMLIFQLLMNFSSLKAPELVRLDSIPSDTEVIAGLETMASHQISWEMILAILISAMIPVASSWRLARFNIDIRQSSNFLGLPTPANALFWTSFCLATFRRSTGVYEVGTQHACSRPPEFDPWIIGAVVFALCTLMLSSIPLPGLKFKHFRWQGNQVIYILIGLGAILVVLYGILAVPLILLLYLLSPLWGRLFPKNE